MVKKSLENQKVERRESPRKAIRTRVELAIGDKKSVEKSENISLTGMFLKANAPENYNINDSVEVSFTDDSGKPVTSSGKIVRKEKDGFAVKMYWRDKEPPPLV